MPLGRKKEKMQSLRHANTDEAIDRAIERAAKAAADAKAAREGSKKPLFLWLKPGQKATIRPLVGRLSGGVKLMKHNQWNKEREYNVSAICACELEPAKPCLYCEMAKENKKLVAGEWFFLPVFVYQVVDEKGNVATYEEKQEGGEKMTKEVKNVVRLLELTPFGRVAPLLKYFKDFPKDPENGLLNERDFTIEQIGEGQAKNFMPDKKNPKPMHEKIKAIAATVTEPEMYERIIAFCPPKVAEGNEDPFEDSPPARMETENLHDVVKDINNGYHGDDMVDRVNAAVDPLDDTITTW